MVLLRRIPLRYVVHYFDAIIVIVINFCIYAAVQYTL